MVQISNDVTAEYAPGKSTQNTENYPHIADGLPAFFMASKHS